MSIISQENLPTVTAVSFVVALLAVALTAVNHQRTSQVAAAVAGFEVGDAKAEAKLAKATSDKIAALEKRVAELESAAAEPMAAADPAGDAAAPAAEGAK